MRITIDIGPSKRGIGAVEGLGLGMMVPFLLDAVLGRLLPPPLHIEPLHIEPEPEPAPAPAPSGSEIVEGFRRFMAAAMAAPPKGRLAEFMEQLMRDMRPAERDILRRRFGGRPEAPDAAPAPVPPPVGGG